MSRARPVLVFALLAALAASGCLSSVPLVDGGPAGSEAASSDGPTNARPRNNSSRQDLGPNATAHRNRTAQADGNATSGDAGNETRGAAREKASPQLPANITLENATLVERTSRKATFVFHGNGSAREPNLEDGPAGELAQNPPQATLTVPPDRWLKLEVTLTWPLAADHVVPEIRYRGIEWCHNLGDPGTASYRRQLSETTSTSCTVRPDPRTGWENWTLQPNWEYDVDSLADPFRKSAFEMTLELTAMEGPWADLEPTPTPEGWPARQDAPIRPGAKIGRGDCTANFVFRSPDNASLYVGTANHCFDEHGHGTMLTVGGVRDAGRIAYCSWGAMPEHEGPGCRFPGNHEAGEGPREYHNDLVLVEIRPDLRDEVHPALGYWGGPTGLAGNVSEGDRVLGFGNSFMRDANEPAAPDRSDPVRGYVSGRTDTWVTGTTQVQPGVPGDSGSPVLLGSGAALGLVQTLGVACPGTGSGSMPARNALASNGVSNMAPMLEALRNRTDLEVELVTWPLLREPAFPASPADPSPGPISCEGS